MLDILDDLERDIAAPSKRVERHFRPDIQGIRAVAVLLVVLYHAHVPGITGGFVGVDVFFVISGFLITGQLNRELQRKGRISFVAFYGRRMRRLLPPAALVVLVTLVVARIWSTAAQVRSLIHDVLWTAVYGVNYHLAAQGVEYQNADRVPSPVQHFWSLAVEEQFYVVWPLVLALCAIAARRTRTAFTAGVLGGIVIVSLTLSVVMTASQPSSAYFSLQTRGWELGLGALVAFIAPLMLRVTPGRARWLSWLGLSAVVASAFLYGDSTAYPGSAAMLPVLGTAVLIAAGCCGQAVGAERLLALRGPQVLGKVSYAWYLWHWPMLILLPQATGVVSFSWQLNLEIVFLAWWAAVLTYFLENASLRSALRLHFWVPTGVGLSAGLVGFAFLLGVTLLPTVGDGAAQAAPLLLTGDSQRVQSVLSASLGLRQAPRNLTPSLDDAFVDRPENDCHRGLLSVDASPCTFGSTAPDAPVAVLVGDSHAQQWLGSLLPNVRAHGWRLYQWTKAACPVADLLVWNSDLKRLYPECSQWRAKVQPQIAALKPQLLIVAQSDVVPWNSITDSLWASKTVNAVKALSSRGTRTVYLADTPQTNTDPVDCLYHHLSDIRRCDYSKVDAFQGYPGFAQRHVSVEQAIRRSGFSWVDTLPYFCTATKCPVVVGNLTVRRDRGHITNTYAAWLAPVFAPLFARTS